MRTAIEKMLVVWKGVSEEACSNLSRYLNRRSSLAADPFEPTAHLEVCQYLAQRQKKLALTNYENLP